MRNVCIYMRRGLKSGSGPLTRRSTTSSSQTRLDFFLTFILRRGVLLSSYIYFMWNKFIFSKVKGPPLKFD